MTTITLVKTDTGKVAGHGEKNARAWAKFKKVMSELEPGELLSISTWFPRNKKLHGLHFALLAALFEAQEQFEDPDRMRMWLHVGAGLCDFLPGPTGRMVAVPKSIAWDKLDDADFQAHHEAVKAFMRGERAQMFLWPHLPPGQAADMVETVLLEFER